MAELNVKTYAITEVNGQAFYIDAEGAQVPLAAGMTLNAGTLLVTQGDGSVQISGDQFNQTLGANNLLALPGDNIEDGAQVLNADEIDLAALQQAILDGTDPTLAFEAAAAGAPGIAGSGNAGGVTIERTGAETLAEAGFDTGLPPVPEGPEFENPLDPVIETAAEPVITAPDFIPTYTLVGSTVDEGEFATITISLDGPTDEPLVFSADIGTFFDTATDGLDYQSGALEYLDSADGQWKPVDQLQPEITLQAGDIELQLRVPTFEDQLVEGLEGFISTINLESGTALNSSEQVIDYINDTSAAVVTLSGPESVGESDGEAIYTLTLNQVMNEDVVVNLTFSPGSATGGGVDYSEQVSPVVIPAGSQSIIFVVPITDDALTEGNEDYSVAITSVSSNALIGAENSITTTIIDDEGEAQDGPFVTLTGPDSIGESDGNAVYTVHLSEASSQDITVTLGYLPGTATGGGVDYSEGAAQITIAAGQLSGEVSVAITDDALSEVDETYTVTLTGTSGGESQLGAAISVETTIIEDEGEAQDGPFVTLTGPDSIGESDGNAVYTVHLSEASSQDITVTLGYLPGTATGGGVDYSEGGAQITIAAGQLSGEVSVAITDDALSEVDETYTVTLTGTSGGESQLGAAISVETTIIEDEGEAQDGPFVTLTGPDSIGESDGNAVYTVHLSEASSQDITVTLGYLPGTATGGGVDYSEGAAQITIAAGQLSGEVSVAITDDALSEVDETYTVTLTGTSGGESQLGAAISVETTIIEDEGEAQDGPFVTLTGPDSIGESDGNAVYTVHLSEASSQDITVTLGYLPGTATGGGVDYSEGAAQITIAAGQLSGEVSVAITDDALSEVDETYTVTLTGTSGGESQLGAAISVETTIIEDEGEAQDGPFVTLTGPDSIGESDGNAVYTVHLSEASSQDITVTLGYLPGTATGGGVDYSEGAAQITIAAGQLSGEVSVAITDDALSEVDETYTVTLTGTSGGESQLGAAISVETTIIEDEGEAQDGPFVTLTGPDSIGESDGNAVYTVHLSEASSQDITVTLGYLPGTATGGGVDYSEGAAQITIAAGQLSGEVSVAITDDALSEVDETYTVTLTGTSGGESQLGAAISVETTIIEDEGEAQDGPFVTLTGPDSIGESDGNAVYTVHLSEASSQDITVTLGYLPGTATGGGVDYSEGAAQITIAAGQLSGEVSVAITDDALSEVDETYTVTLTGTSGGESQLGAAISVETTIIEDEGEAQDGPFVTLTGPDSIGESDGNAVYTVHLSEASSQDITVTLGYLPGTATGGGVDYSEGAAQITIAAGQLSGEVSVAITDDALSEVDETYTVTLTGTSGGESQLGAAISVETTIIEDEGEAQDGPFVTLTGPDSIGESDGNAVYTVHLSEASSQDITVTLGYLPGTAAGGGVDYSEGAAQITIAAGQLSGEVSVAITDDALSEVDETYTVTLTGTSGGESQLGAAISVETTIIEDEGEAQDGPFVTLTGPDSIGESDGNAVYTVHLSEASSQDITVTLGYLPGTATGGGVDYSEGAAQITIAAGQLSGEVSVHIEADQLFEQDETYMVQLTSTAGGESQLGDAVSVETLIVEPNHEPEANPDVANVSFLEAGAYWVNTRGEMGFIDVEAHQVTTYSTERGIYELAITPNGTIYGVSSDTLYQLNGDGTVLGSVELSFTISNWTALGAVNQQMLYGMEQNTGNIYQIDIATGQIESLGIVSVDGKELKGVGDLVVDGDTVYMAAGKDIYVTEVVNGVIGEGILLNIESGGNSFSPSGSYDGIGIGADNGDLYAFSNSKLIYQIDPVTGNLDETYDVKDILSSSVNGFAWQTEEQNVDVSGNVLTNDLDPEGEPLLVVAVDDDNGALGEALDGDYGSLTLNADGSYTYTLDTEHVDVVAGLALVDQFSYTISDAEGAEATSTLDILINGAALEPEPEFFSLDLIEFAEKPIVLTGTEGEDQFIITDELDHSAPALYQVVDFGEEDTLDLSHLLSDVDEEDLGDYIELSFTEEGDSVLQIWPEGDGESSHTIVLHDVDLRDEYPGFSESQILEQLIDDERLLLDGDSI